MLDGSTKVTQHLVDWDARVDTQVILPDGLEIERDAIVDVWGEFDDDGVLRDQQHRRGAATPAAAHRSGASADPRRIATILVRVERWRLPESATANAEMFTGDASTNVFYAENSYGIETMSGRRVRPLRDREPRAAATPD